MRAENIRKRLHQYIEKGDERLLKLVCIIAKKHDDEDDFDDELSEEEIKLFEERRAKRLSGRSKTNVWQEAKEIIAGNSRRNEWEYTDEVKMELNRRYACYINGGKIISATEANRQIRKLLKKDSKH